MLFFFASGRERGSRRRRGRNERKIDSIIKPAGCGHQNINAVFPASFKWTPFALNCSCVLCEHAVPRPLASTAIMDLALVITHFQISDVTSKQQQPCQQSTHYSPNTKPSLKDYWSHTLFCCWSLIQLIARGFKLTWKNLFWNKTVPSLYLRISIFCF